MSNYNVKVGQTVVEVTKVTYNAETRKATLTVNLNKMEGLLSVNGIEKSFDFKAPEIASITPVSSTVFDINFSEEVNPALAQTQGNYLMVQTGTATSFTGKISNVKVIAKDKVRVTMTEALVKDKSYTVTVSKLQDVSENKNTMTESSSMAFTAIKDETKPTLISATALDANKVELKMSEELKSTATASVSATLKKVNADGTLGTAIANVVASDSKDPSKLTLTISNAQDYLTNGANYQVQVSGGSDVEGNAIAENQAMNFVGKADDQAPTVASYTFVDGKLILTFSEAMDTASLTNAANYAVFETVTGYPQTVATVVENEAKDHTQAILSFTGLEAGKEYSVRINNLKDASLAPGNALTANTIVKFTVPTVNTEIILTGATETTDGKSIDLTFNAPLVRAEAENAANYQIVETADASKTLEVTKAVYDANTNKVTLTTGSQVDGTNNYKVIVSNLTNLSTKENEISATFDGLDKTKAVMTGVETLGLNAVDLVFNEKMATDQSSGVAVSVVEKGTANVVAVQSLTNAAGHDNNVRVTFANGALTEGKTYTLTIVGAKDGSASINQSDAASIDFTATKDATAPKMVSAVSTNAATIELAFDEEIAKQGTLSSANFQFKKGTEEVNFAANTTFDISSDKKKLTIVNGGNTPVALFENNVDYTITAIKDDVNFISDVTGNAVTNAICSFKGVKDTTKPQLVSAVMKADSDEYVILTFSEKINTAAALNPADFTVTEANTGIKVDVTEVPVVGTDDKTNEVTLKLDAKTKVGTEYKVYVNNKNESVKDLAVSPNLVDATHAVALFQGTDKTAPTVTAKELKDGKTIAITFNEKINASSVAKTDFVVDGNTVTLADISDDRQTITLTLEKALTTSAEGMVVKFADNEYITDDAGNKFNADINTIVDKAAPTLVSAVKTGASELTLTFSEKLAAINDMSALEQAVRNGIVTVDGYTVTNIQAAADGTTVVLTIAEDMVDVLPTVRLVKGQEAIKDAVNNIYAGGDIVIATAIN